MAPGFRFSEKLAASTVKILAGGRVLPREARAATQPGGMGTAWEIPLVWLFEIRADQLGWRKTWCGHSLAQQLRGSRYKGWTRGGKEWIHVLEL